MLKQAFFSFKFAHFSLFCIGLMWLLPFLYYPHALPLTTFYQEWGAALLGLCAMPLLLSKRYWQQPEVPRVILLPLGMTLLVMLQFAMGKIDYFSQALLVALYLLWAALLVMLGQRLREELGLPLIVTVLAAFLLLGAELNALVGIYQHFRWRGFLDRVVLAYMTGGVFGNMGQQNHFANYISLGLISLGLLYVRWQLRVWQVVCLALPLLFVLMLSGSRSAGLYLICLAVMAFFWQRRDKFNRPLLHYSLALVLGLVLMYFLVQHPWLAGGQSEETIVTRMSGAHGGGLRLHIWYEAWLVLTSFPLFGSGFGQFGWQNFLLGPSLHDVRIQGLYNNAHNLVMQTAAEMGLAGLLLLFGTLALWVRQLFDAPRTVYYWWGSGLLVVQGIHSLLEYPLWYVYFLGIAALTLGLLDSTVFRLELRSVGRLSVALILLLGVLCLAEVWQGYRRLENLTYLRQTSITKQDFLAELVTTHQQVLLQPYVEMALTNSVVEIPDGKLNIIRELNESVMHFAPTRAVVYREVVLLALAGNQEEAQLQFERALWAYPGGVDAALEQLRFLAQKDPAHFAALLEFATQKYKEYQVAVRAE